jgi:hypothetical protein
VSDVLVGIVVLIFANVLVGTLLINTPDSIGKYILVGGFVIADILAIIGLFRGLFRGGGS